jgi:hypothetical protein
MPINKKAELLKEFGHESLDFFEFFGRGDWIRADSRRAGWRDAICLKPSLRPKSPAKRGFWSGRLDSNQRPPAPKRDLKGENPEDFARFNRRSWLNPALETPTVQCNECVVASASVATWSMSHIGSPATSEPFYGAMTVEPIHAPSVSKTPGAIRFNVGISALPPVTASISG